METYFDRSAARSDMRAKIVTLNELIPELEVSRKIRTRDYKLADAALNNVLRDCHTAIALRDREPGNLAHVDTCNALIAELDAAQAKHDIAYRKMAATIEKLSKSERELCDLKLALIESNRLEAI